MADSAKTAAAELESAAEQAIAAWDGDARAAVAELIAANALLEQEIARLSAGVSTGYARGRVRNSGR